MADKKKKILIVDDDRFLLDMYSVKFHENGFDVVSAMGGEEALGKIKEGGLPDVILLDLVMPNIDGFEVLERLKADANATRVPAIVLTNLGEASDIDRAMKLGATGYIVKASCTPSEVVEKVNATLLK